MKYALAYNAFHNLESIGIEGKSEKLIQYTYKNGNGRLKQMTYANGHTMKAVYNSIGQMVAEKWFETKAAAASSIATPIAHYKYVYDGDGNIVRSIDISYKKEYNYEYDEGRIVRATEADIELSGEIVTSKVIVNTVKYYYDTEGKMTKKVITPASGSAQTTYYENKDDSTVVKFSAGGRTVTSHSKTDSFGRKVFDELQLGTDFVSRQFVYHAGKVTAEHKTNAKVKSSATTQLVSQIILSNGTTLSYGYDAEERITSVVETYTVDDTPVTNTTLYTYDALGQLLTETVNGEVVNSMEYDNYGNITKKNGKAYTYGDATWKDLLTGFDGKTIEYDTQGNPVKYLGHTLTWEKGRQLKKFDNIEYTYNANGIRTSKKVNGVCHFYTLDGSEILGEFWEGNTLVPLYVGEFAKNTFGAGVVQSQTYDTMSMDTLIAGYETGFSSSSVICGDISKPISVYAKNASEWWKVWEYKVGIQINIGNGGFYLETNPLENAMGVSNGNTSLELMSGLNKIGYTASYEVDFSERTSGRVYQHGYIRTIPTAAAVVTTYYCWTALVGALGTGVAVGATPQNT